MYTNYCGYSAWRIEYTVVQFTKFHAYSKELRYRRSKYVGFSGVT